MIPETKRRKATRCHLPMLVFLLLWSVPLRADPGGDAEDVLVVIGAAGEAQYGEQFEQWAAYWRQAADATNRRLRMIAPADSSPVGERTAGPVANAPADNPGASRGATGPEVQATQQKQQLQQALAECTRLETDQPLWLALVGHGTFDGKVAKFNLQGPDLTSQELRDWLAGAKRPVVVILCFSCSGAFLKDLAAPNRIVITSTKSGREIYFSRFGQYLAQALCERAADLDKDEQVSVLEVFLMASRQTQEFYKNASRLATEHALLDDNGDGLGTPAEAYRGVRPQARSHDGSPIDGDLARHRYWLRSQLAELSTQYTEALARTEQQIRQLQSRKSSMKEDDYYAELEKLLLDLIRIRKQ